MTQRRLQDERLLWPLIASALILTAQAWSGGGELQQSAATAPGNLLEAGLTPTTHAPVPARLEAMWYVPGGDPPSSAAVPTLARGVQMLDEGGERRRGAALVNNPALRKTAVGDYARY